LICAAVMVAFPLASSCTVMGCAMAVGGVLSCTVTTAVAVEALPAASVTVKVTLFAPIFEGPKVVLFKAYVAIPTLSVDPLFTWAAVIVAWPVASSCTVMFCAIATGEV